MIDIRAQRYLGGGNCVPKVVSASIIRVSRKGVRLTLNRATVNGIPIAANNGKDANHDQLHRLEGTIRARLSDRI